MAGNKFAAALKPAQASTPTPDKDPDGSLPASPHARPSRQQTKHVGGYFDPAVSKQLREIAVQEDSSLQSLLAEAIDMLFQSRRKPTIAQKRVKS